VATQNVNSMNEWSLVKKIKGLDLTQKCFETDELEKSVKHEAQIEKFSDEIEAMGHEIFKIKGHQFITSDGVYTIAHKSEVQYGE
jgi:hypothetical protein